jgi:hypothetical protein
MAGAVVLLMGTVALTLVTNWLRRIPGPLNPERIRAMTSLLLELPDEELTLQRRMSHLNDVAGLWIDILAEQQHVNILKARFVRTAQLLLGLAIVLIGFLLILVLQRL